MRRRTGDAVDGRHRARSLPHARFPFFPHHLDGGGRCHCRPAVPSVPHSGYVWALGAAALLPLSGTVSFGTTWHAVAEGRDVYLFLVGMMVLAELARREGLFDWLALYAVRHAGGSGRRLFDLVFLVGTLVTVFLSNDATAVVLTPAVYAACKAARPIPCRTCSSVPSSPTRPASCCPSPTRPISWCTASTCRRCCSGWRSSHCPRWRRSVRPILCCAGCTVAKSHSRWWPRRRIAR